MATLIAYADGNLTGATTFKGAETGASALAMVRASAQTLAQNTNLSTPAFTITNTKVIEGVLLFMVATATSPAGTLLVELQKSSVTQASVTINCADLPNGVTNGATISLLPPIFCKFTGTATGDGTANWTLKLTVSNTTNAGITYARNSGTSGDFTRALRTATAATAAAADDLYVVGELTGAGTHNSRTVTMDSTATTAYGNGSVNSISVNGGGVRVSNYGTLSYGTTASTNYVLRINGDLEVCANATLNIGSNGAEIPRTSTAVLEFQQASADGDFGLRCMPGATANIYGLSRTSAKNVTRCKLTGDVTGLNVLTSGPTALNVTNATSGGLDAGGTSLLASTAIDTVTNANHTLVWSGPAVTNTTQTFQVWLARGTGTNNRFVRLEVGNNTTFASVTKGFFADVDLQAATIGTCTAIGTGTATSSSITAVGGGFLCTITGKVDSSSATPSVFIAICSAAGTTSFAGANNQALLYEGVQLVSAASIGSTTFNVDTDTGWKSGDVVVVATSSRATISDCEGFVLNADAGASSFTSAEHPLGYGGPTGDVTGMQHSGTSPIQCEIGLLTRNVKIRSTSNTLMAYVYCTALATCTFQWAQFYYLGSITSSKRGIEIDGAASANAKSITFCAVHDCDTNGLYLNTNSLASINTTFSNNVMWYSQSSNMITVSGSVSSGNYTFDSNVVMKCAGVGFQLTDVGGGTVTNNWASSCSTNGFGYVVGGTLTGSFNGNIAHTCQTGLNFPVANFNGTIDTFTAWHCSSAGVGSALGTTSELFFHNITLLGNSNGFTWSGTHCTITGTGSTLASTSTQTCTNGFSFSAGGYAVFSVDNLDMSGTGTGLAVCTNDITIGGTFVQITGVFRNCKQGSTVIGSRSNLNASSYVSFEKYGQTAGDHRTEMVYGQIKTDTTFFNTASPSMRLTPNNASNKLESAPTRTGNGILVPVANGAPKTVSAYIRKSAVGDGAAYNGNQPRLIQRANPALGQNADVVLATYSSSTGSWNQISGATSTPTDDGAFEIIVDCDGTAGWVNIDDLAAA